VEKSFIILVVEKLYIFHYEISTIINGLNTGVLENCVCFMYSFFHKIQKKCGYLSMKNNYSQVIHKINILVWIIF